MTITLLYEYCRGATNNDFFGTSPIEPKEKTYTWTGVGEALTMALKMEKDVTGRMKDMIDVCSTSGRDDPHAADWLTGKVVLHHIFSYSFCHINSSFIINRSLCPKKGSRSASKSSLMFNVQSKS